MKSRTSFFNPTVLKKDITRFAPLWGIYGILVFLFVISIGDFENSARFANNAGDIMSFMGIVNFAYAGVCAMMLFGDLYNTRLCYSLHTFSLRREGWFLTHLVSALVMFAVPNLFGMLVACIGLRSYSYYAILWFALMLLQFLTFFGIAAFSAMCAGNRLGMAAVYALVNFFGPLLSWVITTFYEPFLYGMVLDLEWMNLFSPVVSMSGATYVNTEFDNAKDITVFKGFETGEWLYLAILAVVGMGLLIAALGLYRKRKLETAGDFIALKPVAYVFTAVYTIFCGVLLSDIAEVVSTVIGLTIGFFTGRMLLEKKVNVFRKKNWLAFLGLIATFAVTITLTWLDPVGITRYVPETEKIESVRVSPYSYQDGIVLTSENDINVIREIHRNCTLRKNEMTDSETQARANLGLTLRYQMKDGSTVYREYDIYPMGESGQILEKYYSTEAYVLGALAEADTFSEAYQIDFYCHNDSLPYMGFVEVNADYDENELREKFGYDKDVEVFHTIAPLSDAEVVRGLMDAIRADCAAGNMAQHYSYHEDESGKNEQVGELVFQYVGRYEDDLTKTYSASRDIRIYADCENTIAYLQSLVDKG